VGSSSVPVRLYNAGFVRVYAQCHDVAVDFDWLACVERFAQTSNREPADAQLQGDAVLDPV
jgi:hypothetical protein